MKDLFRLIQAHRHGDRVFWWLPVGAKPRCSVVTSRVPEIKLGMMLINRILDAGLQRGDKRRCSALLTVSSSSLELNGIELMKLDGMTGITEIPYIVWRRR